MNDTDTLDGEYRTGQIKLHDSAAFEGMRKAGRLAVHFPEKTRRLMKALWKT